MNNKIRHRPVIYLIGTALAVVSASVFSVAAEPNWLEVRVFDKHSERAVSNAAVCLGTTAKPDQFGAERSNADGVVRFENLGHLRVQPHQVDSVAVAVPPVNPVQRKSLQCFN